MKYIIIVTMKYRKMAKYFDMLTDKFKDKIIHTQSLRYPFELITKDFHITMGTISSRFYIGRNPDYHYTDCMEIDDYLENKKSVSLNGIEDIVRIMEESNESVDNIKKEQRWNI